eukprot:NODE_569_length_5912_cov_0.495957.p1 type:complete len:466 gc:universal NODE_569_length_5912_cov_0.495957:4423-5820(+)
MHLNGIAHNDVKSNNIMIDSLYMPRIIDLGMAKITNSTVSTIGKNRTIGTDQWRAPEYWQMSPDNMRYRKEYPFAGDIYAFAIVLGEIATKIIPWIDFSSEDIKQAVCQGMRPYSNTDIKSHIFQFIEKCWSTNPQNRPDMTEIKNFLLTLVSPPSFKPSLNNPLFANNYQPKINSATPIPPKPITPTVDLSNLYGLDLLDLLKQSIFDCNLNLFEPLLIRSTEYIFIHDLALFFKTLCKNHAVTLNQFKTSLKSSHLVNDSYVLALISYYNLFSKSKKQIYTTFLESIHRNSFSLVILGELCKNGYGVVKSKEEAFNYFEKAAKLNIPLAQVKLGDCYRYGNGCKRNHTLAHDYYNLAAKANCPQGFYSLGYKNENPLYSLKQAACEHLIKGAKYGSIECISYLLDIIEDVTPFITQEVRLDCEKKLFEYKKYGIIRKYITVKNYGFASKLPWQLQKMYCKHFQ